MPSSENIAPGSGSSNPVTPIVEPVAPKNWYRANIHGNNRPQVSADTPAISELSQETTTAAIIPRLTRRNVFLGVPEVPPPANETSSIRTKKRPPGSEEAESSNDKSKRINHACTPCRERKARVSFRHAL